MRRASFIISGSTCSRPAVSTITTFRPSRVACLRAFFATRTGSFPSDDSTEPGPTWWLCPPCHEALLGKATLANRSN